MRIGVLGLGRMGAPIAAALAERNEVVAFDPLRTRRQEVQRSGSPAVIASTLREATSHAEVLVTVLPGVAEFEECAPEIINGLVSGTLWIDLTSNDPRVAERTATRAVDRDIAFVAAPMSGGPTAAHDQTVRFSLSGDAKATERARQVLSGITTPDGITVVGSRVSDAYAVKLLGNLLWFGQAVAVTEAVLLGTAMGFEPGRLLQLLAAGPGSSTLLERDFSAVLDGDYLPQFAISRVVEELETLTALATEHDVPFQLSALITRIHQEALDRFGPIDGELLATRLLEERAGHPIRSAT